MPIGPRAFIIFQQQQHVALKTEFHYSDGKQNHVIIYLCRSLKFCITFLFLIRQLVKEMLLLTLIEKWNSLGYCVESDLLRRHLRCRFTRFTCCSSRQWSTRRTRYRPFSIERYNFRLTNDLISQQLFRCATATLSRRR